MHFLFITEIMRGCLAKRQSGRVEFGNIIYRFALRNSRFVFPFFFSNNSFKNIGLAITFASDWNKAEHGAFSVEGKKSSPVTTVESIMRPEKTVSLSLSTLSSLT